MINTDSMLYSTNANMSSHIDAEVTQQMVKDVVNVRYITYLITQKSNFILLLFFCFVFVAASNIH
jgi:hypothetical protein